MFVRKKDATLRPNGVYHDPLHALGSISKACYGDFYMLIVGLGVARFDERVYQNLTEWSEQRLSSTFL